MENNTNISKDFQKDKSEQPFFVPENYFEEFPERLKKRLNKEKQRKEKRIFTILKPYVAAAAIITGLFFTWNIIIELSIENHSVTDDVIMVEKIDAELYYIDEDIIWEVYNNPEEMESSTSLANIDTDLLVDYLCNEDIDYDTITEEL
jgi:hypothetical protein